MTVASAFSARARVSSDDTRSALQKLASAHANPSCSDSAPQSSRAGADASAPGAGGGDSLRLDALHAAASITSATRDDEATLMAARR